ncbi:MAG TPA: putative maltokinase, partial [Thermoanaerobaculia bacterium]|nr:putative maltokinase [Thermoanaerobaculia bacterium]
NPHSLLSWTKRLIALRRRYRAFGRGTIEFLKPANPKVAAFIRTFEDETILVVANLSRFAQHVELDLSRWSGVAPLELFGQSRFPRIGELPYLLTLGGHGFYWFSLSEESSEEALPPGGAEGESEPILSVRGNWQKVFGNAELDALELALARWLPHRRWFAGKAKRLRELSISNVVPIAAGRRIAALLVLTADYGEGEPETYALFLGFASGAERQRLERDQPSSIVARLDVASRKGGSEHGVLFDAIYQERFCDLLLNSIAGGKSFRLAGGAPSEMELNAVATPAFKRLGGLAEPRGARLMGAEQSNTSIVYGDRLVLKLFRRFEEGENPDLEIGRYLSETAGFVHVPAVAGSLDFIGKRGRHHTLGILQAFVENQGDAWHLALDAAGRFFERVSHRRPRNPHASSAHDLLSATRRPLPSSAREVIGLFAGSAELLGRRTAELHQALAAGSDEAFRPQAFTLLFQRSLYQSFRTSAVRTLDRLAAARASLGAQEQRAVDDLLALRDRLIQRSRALLDHKIEAQRIRCHGDYHLGQILATGRDFVIIDFEGEPARPLGERRIKRSPLSDVAGMMRSFHYAAHTALEEAIDSGVLSPAQRPAGEHWADYWSHWNGAAFLGAYLETMGRAPLLPANDDDLVNLLDIFLLDKALYELRYELDHRPTWLRVPLASFARLLP